MSSADDYSECSNELPETKRKSRNESEKRRRDALNKLISELRLLVAPSDRTVDKSAVLRHTIHYLNVHSCEAAQNSLDSKAIDRDNESKRKVPFLSERQFETLFFQSTDAFYVVLAHDGKMLNKSAHLGCVLESQGLSSSILNKGINFCDLLESSSAQGLKNFLSNEILNAVQHPKAFSERSLCAENLNDNPRVMLTFTGIAHFTKPFSIINLSISNGLNPNSNLQFSIIFNMEWRFMSLDQRAQNILGYGSRDLMGKSGLNYCHLQDLPTLTNELKSLCQQTHCIFSPYRFLTKSKKWLTVNCQANVGQSATCHSVKQIVCTYKVKFPSDLLSSSNSLTNPVTDLGANDCNRKSIVKERHILNPQPGVSIEHSPITYPTNKQPIEACSQRLQKSSFESEIWEKLRHHQITLQQQVANQRAELMSLQRQLTTRTPEFGSRNQCKPATINHIPCKRL